MRNVVAATFLVCSLTAPIFAQTIEPRPWFPQARQPRLLPQPKPMLPPVPSLKAPASPSATPNPKIVCGMKVFPANPGIDQGILKHPPAGGIDFRIRLVEPTACRAATTEIKPR